MTVSYSLTLPVDRGLINPFRGLIANAAQSHDLLNFNKIGRENFELRIKAYVLKTPSVKVPQTTNIYHPQERLQKTN